MITKASEQFSGPAYVGIGDPVGGGSMVDLGLQNEVSVKVDFFRQSATNPIGQALADGQYGAVVGGTVSLTMQKQTAAIMAALFPEITATAGGRGFETDVNVLTLDSMVIQPIAQFGNGVATADTMWCPAVRPDDMSELRRVLQSGAGASDDANPFTVTFALALRDTDQAGQAIASTHRLFFFGDPEDGLPATPTAWTGPTGY